MYELFTSPNVIVVLAAAMLIAALVFVRRLVLVLPPSTLRRRWYLIGVVVFLVICGYVAHAGGAGATETRLSNLLVPMVFFLGSCIVLVVCVTAVQTAEDVRRIAVLERQSVTDPLTGLYNRRYLEDRLRQEIRRARRYGFPLSVLLVDADHFKQINDTWGHDVGDEALVALASLCASTIRPQEILARYGGEEFVIVVPATATPGAEVLAERLRRLVLDSVLVPSGKRGNSEDVRLTVTIGVASLAGESDDQRRLLTRADAALYQAKRKGRNQVAVSHEA